MVTQQRKQKTTLSTMQRKRLVRLSILIVLLSLLWLFFAPGSGLYHLKQRQHRLAELVAEKDSLTQQNKEMQEDIMRLQNDEEYLEKVARERHGMLKKNEVVFEFEKKEKKK